MVKKAFVNYLDHLDNLTHSLDVLIIMDRTTFQQILPISLKASYFDCDLLTTPKMLKTLFTSIITKRKIFICKKVKSITDS